MKAGFAPGSATRQACLEQPRCDAAKLAEPGAPARKKRPQQPRHSKHVLAVRDRGDDVFLDPLTVEQHPFLVAARTEVPRLTRETQEVVVPASVAPDAGEAEVRIPAFGEAVDRLLLDRTFEPAGGAQFPGMTRDAVVQRACPRIARAVSPGARRAGVPASHPACNACRSTEAGSRQRLDRLAKSCKRKALGQR